MVEPAEHGSLAAERRREALRVSRIGIGARLSRMFDDLVNEPAPEHWIDLLKMADARAEEQQSDMRRRRFG